MVWMNGNDGDDHNRVAIEGLAGKEREMQWFFIINFFFQNCARSDQDYHPAHNRALAQYTTGYECGPK